MTIGTSRVASGVTSAPVSAHAIIGESPAIVRLRYLIRKVAPSSLPVLIHGPTGSGKELIAQALHTHSGRRGRFVAFNVCAIAESMFEDALFGHVRGAFTGATSDAAGYLMEADRGTVFLDEIGSLAFAPQAKLLRAIELQEFRPVGASVDRHSDFRVVAATNEHLEELAESGRFRWDLLHRLGGIVLKLPPLRERAEDIPLLIRHILDNIPTSFGVAPSLTTDALHAAQRYEWPGNVRELRQVLESALLLSDDATISVDALTPMLSKQGRAHPAPNGRTTHRQRLLELLQTFDWDTGRVAEHLEVHRATVYRRMKQLGIPTPERMTA